MGVELKNNMTRHKLFRISSSFLNCNYYRKD